MSSVRPKLGPDTPKVVTAWDVETGATVYRTAEGQWSETLASAAVLKGDEATTALEAAAKEETRILDPYVMEVTESGDVSGRETLRETIRAVGPTIHPEYHKDRRMPANAVS
tara:strand:+ start:968 stop:1303 length:336 start_codon:yes stop_codon:yes gene_type:complete